MLRQFGPRRPAPAWSVLAIAVAFVLAGCGQGGGGSPPPVQTTPGGVSPATGTDPPPIGTNPPPVDTNPPPAGITTFHLVIADGPKAGTYDVTSSEPGACSSADEGYWATLFDAFGESGLAYVAASMTPQATTMGYAFDTGSEDHLAFVGVGDVSFDVDDRGSSATFTIVSESSVGTYHSDFSTVETGGAELTVECASVLPPG